MNRCGSSRGGGDAREVEPHRCLLTGINFLGAMVVDRGVEICKHNKKMREGEERVAKIHVEGKMKRCASLCRAQNIRRYAATKGSTQRRSVSTQRRRTLRCCVPESGKRATQRRWVLRCYGPES